MKRCACVLLCCTVTMLVGGGCAHLPGRGDPAAPGSATDEAEAVDALPEREPADPLAAARSLYEAGDYADALILCVELAQRIPPPRGLEELRNKILVANMERRTIAAASDVDTSQTRMMVEALEAAVVPATYGLEKPLAAVTDDAQEEPSPVFAALTRPVTMHLQGAQIATIITALSTDTNINIIADAGLAEGKVIDVEIDDVPLKEVLDYIGRNFDVRFYYGHSMIWVTAGASAATLPLKTRVFALKTGLQFQGGDWGPLGKEATQVSDIQQIAYKATVLPGEKTYLEQIIEDFVPEVEGAKLHFDRNTHSLFVRNTPENLELVARIVDILDVSPPQVLIEARFVEVALSDLRELGIEWILDSPLVVSKTALSRDGTLQDAVRSQIDEGGGIGFDPFTSDEDGVFPLGPQGSFGLDRDGNKPTAPQGLNISYRGVLTEPMFQAVIHALEISGKGQTLSVPRVTTLNNSPAKLRSGQDLYYFNKFQAQALQLLDDNNKRFTLSVLIPDGEPKLEELGVTLVAVPSVGADRRSISLLLTPTISRLEGFVSYQDEEAEPATFADVQQVVAKLPTFSRREIQTKLVVESGETVVLGGLIDTVSQETEYRVPILGSLPWIGAAFRRADVTEENKNLLVFVTATVISERGESMRAGIATAPTTFTTPSATP